MFVLASTLFFAGFVAAVWAIHGNIANSLPRIKQVIAQRNGLGLKKRVIHIGAVRSTKRPSAVVLAFTPKTDLSLIARAGTRLKMAA